MGVFNFFKRGPIASVTVRASMGAPSAHPPEGYKSPYLPAAEAKELLVPGIDGTVPLTLTQHGGAWWLTETTTGKLVNVAQRQLRGLGLWTCRVRGTDWADRDVRLGSAELVREPENEYDPNAVAIHQDGRKVGYYNKAMASGLARALDSGEVLDATVISVDPPKVVAASHALMKQLLNSRRH